MIDFLYALALGILVAIAVFQLLRRDLIKAAMGFSILFASVNLYLLAVGAFDGDTPPYTDEIAAGGNPSDPLVQALVLTAIVVSFGSYALLLSFVDAIARRSETLDSDEVNDLVG